MEKCPHNKAVGNISYTLESNFLSKLVEQKSRKKAKLTNKLLCVSNLLPQFVFMSSTGIANTNAILLIFWCFFSLSLFLHSWQMICSAAMMAGIDHQPKHNMHQRRYSVIIHCGLTASIDAGWKGRLFVNLFMPRWSSWIGELNKTMPDSNNDNYKAIGMQQQKKGQTTSIVKERQRVCCWFLELLFEWLDL